jgi:hypothetical protein
LTFAKQTTSTPTLVATDCHDKNLCSLGQRLPRSLYNQFTAMSSLTTLDKPVGMPATSIVRIVDTLHTQQMQKNTATVVDSKSLLWNGETTFELNAIYEDQNSSQMFGQNIGPLISSYFCFGLNVAILLVGETKSPLMAQFYGKNLEYQC